MYQEMLMSRATLSVLTMETGYHPLLPTVQVSHINSIIYYSIIYNSGMKLLVVK